jgi:hypothetical protein
MTEEELEDSVKDGSYDRGTGGTGENQILEESVQDNETSQFSAEPIIKAQAPAFDIEAQVGLKKNLQNAQAKTHQKAPVNLTVQAAGVAGKTAQSKTLQSEVSAAQSKFSAVVFTADPLPTPKEPKKATKSSVKAPPEPAASGSAGDDGDEYSVDFEEDFEPYETSNEDPVEKEI